MRLKTFLPQNISHHETHEGLVLASASVCRDIIPAITR
jgi:hypothetical protein